MSFILDAIAKSEQERQQQEAPGAQILAMPVGSARQPRRVLPYLVIGALLLNLALFTIWMQSDQTFQNGGSDSAGPEDRKESAGVGTEETTAGSVNDLARVQSKPATTSVSGYPGSVETTVNKITPKVSGETATDDSSRNWELFESNTSSSKTHSGQQAVLDTEGSQRKISRLSELPRDVRDDLPSVVFSGHLYSSDPDSSLVFVDGGRPVKKGRRIKQDLFLYEITPTGVIVDFRGYLIDVGVLQNWILN